MKMSLPIRILVVVLGGVALLVGLVAWGLETEYGGSGPETVMEFDGETAFVYEFSEQGPLDSEGHPVGVLVFEGSQEAANAYTAAETEGKNYLVPGLIVAAGAIAILFGLLAFRATRQDDASNVGTAT